MSTSCRACSNSFLISSSDTAFYQRLGVPPPTLCPECRLQRKLAHHNQIILFKRKCDATGASLISHFPPDSPYIVYSQPHWWSDAFDASTHGRAFDFNRPFFEQFHELSLAVPRMALMTDYLHDENCPYTNFSGRNKNCYFIFDSDESWDCYYSYTINASRNTLESFRVKNLELCYEAVDSKDCYHSCFIQNCENCWDSYFLESCIGCKNCILCCNLRQKEYHIRNQPVSRETYETFRQSLGSFARLTEIRTEFTDLIKRFPRRTIRGFHNENVTGDYLVHCKNAEHCFDCLELWDGKYCYQGFMPLKDCMDCEECGEAELLYECANLGYNAYNCRFTHQGLNQLTNLTYCDHCFNGCSDLFGCISLKRKKYCILNKEYSKAEYEALIPRIIAHMEETGEWGEFFPMSLSPFPYNMSMAQEQFPLSKTQVLALGLKWFEQDPREFKAPSVELPDSIAATNPLIHQELLQCVLCRRNYKIIPQEFAFYQKMNLPLPRTCFHCRHEKRRSGRNPRRLYDRFCEKCGLALKTSFSPDLPDLVYCERCFAEQ